MQCEYQWRKICGQYWNLVTLLSALLRSVSRLGLLGGERVLSLKKPWRKSYAQCGEDLIVEHVFDAIGIRKPSYIDIGAYHPYRLSNTALFYESGSRGINIEPDTMLYKRFKAARKEDINLNIGIADVEGEASLYKMTVPTLNTLSAEEAQSIATESSYKVKAIDKIQVRRLCSVLDQYADGRFPDFLSLDAEGLDFRIIRSICFEDCAPIVICIETLSFSEQGQGRKDQDLITYIESKGYMVYADTHINTIFVRKTDWLCRVD